jgi:uncharacterized membrane protein
MEMLMISFEEPTGIGIDASNNVYVSETDFENCCYLVHHRVIKFTNVVHLLQDGVATFSLKILWALLLIL